MAIAFVPVAVFAAGLSIGNAVVFAVGLLAGNVPEGLLPAITLALAVAVRGLARRGAVVKRLSAVETLGSTDVICTDKTGTLTENRMRPVAAWTRPGPVDLGQDGPPGSITVADGCPAAALARGVVACSNARLDESGEHIGDPTEIALMLAGRALGTDIDPDERARGRAALFHFDPRLKLMSTADREQRRSVAAHQGRAGVGARALRPGARRRRRRGRAGRARPPHSRGPGGTVQPTRDPGDRGGSPTAARGRAAIRARTARDRVDPGRAGGDGGPTPPRGRRRGRGVSPGGDPDSRHHRRSPADRRRDRAASRDRRRSRAPNGDGRPARDDARPAS